MDETVTSYLGSSFLNVENVYNSVNMGTFSREREGKLSYPPVDTVKQTENLSFCE